MFSLICQPSRDMFLPLSKDSDKRVYCLLHQLQKIFVAHCAGRWLTRSLVPKLVTLAAPHRASGASHQLNWTLNTSLSPSDTDSGFHLSEEKETIANSCLFCWQVHAYNKVIFFSSGELVNYTLPLAWRRLIKYLRKLLKCVVPAPAVCRCCHPVMGLKKQPIFHRDSVTPSLNQGPCFLLHKDTVFSCDESEGVPLNRPWPVAGGGGHPSEFMASQERMAWVIRK